MKGDDMRSHSIWLVVLLVAACAKNDRQCPSLAGDTSWQNIESTMNLSESRERRLDDYVNTLEATSCQIARMAPQTRARAAALLDAEIARSIPLFVPNEHRDAAHNYLRGALELQ
jgi:hypothetical protein